jgi:hypothetical protein
MSLKRLNLKRRVKRYGPPVVAAAVAVSLVPPPPREEREQPHTHTEQHVPMNFYGAASIEVVSTASSSTLSFSRLLTPSILPPGGTFRMS